MFQFLPRELSILSELRHTNIIRMHTILNCNIGGVDKVLIVTGIFNLGFGFWLVFRVIAVI